MEDQFIPLHGNRQRRAEKGFTWKADQEKPSEITVLRFKVPQFQRRDGSLSEGPRIVDARKQPWDGAAIGNGSKVIVAFDIYDWDGENGCGMTFQPLAVQVVETPSGASAPSWQGADGYANNRCTSPGLGDDRRSLHCLGNEPRNPPPAAAARGAHPRQALQALGLHPGSGADSVAPGERGGQHHRLEPAAPAARNATNRA
jgi:hypothetical protein